MNGVFQDLTVSVIALGAAVTLVRRALGLFAAKTTSGGCSTCPSGCASATSRRAGAGEDRRIIRPLVIHANSTVASRVTNLPASSMRHRVQQRVDAEGVAGH